MKATEILNLYHTHGEDIMFVPFKKGYVMEAIKELEALQHFDYYEAREEGHKQAKKDLESRNCEGYRHFDKGPYGVCPIAEPLMRQ